MITRHLLPVALSALATACATAPVEPSPIPSDREVIAYVTTNWGYFDARFAFLSDRRDQSPALVSVTDVDCTPEEGHARCTFAVSGRFADGVVLRQPMGSHFRREPDGSIEMLIEVVRR